MTDDKFGQKVGDTLLDPRNNRIWKGLLWLLAILLLVDVALGCTGAGSRTCRK